MEPIELPDTPRSDRSAGLEIPTVSNAPKQAAPVQSQQTAPAPKQSTEPPQTEQSKPAQNLPSWDLSKFLAEKLPDEAPQILGDDKRKIESFTQQRTLLKGALGDLAKAELSQAELKKQLAELQSKITSSGENSEQSFANDPEYKAWQEHKAKTELEQNDSFRQHYDGRRAELLAETEDILTDAGVEKELAEKIFSQNSEYGIANALGELDLDDTAESLLREKGKEFIKLSKERGKATSTDNVFAALKEWQGKAPSASAGANFAGDFAAELGSVAEELAADKDDVFFQSNAGRATIKQLENDLQAGENFSAKQIATAILKSQAAETYRNYAADNVKKVIALENQVANLQAKINKLGGANPAKASTNPAASPRPSTGLAGLINSAPSDMRRDAAFEIPTR